MTERGYVDWTGHFESFLEEANEIRSGKKSAYNNNNTRHDPKVACGMSGKEIWGQEFSEINSNDGYDFQSYFKHDMNGTSYNMIFEHDGDFGYFYLVDTTINCEFQSAKTPA